MNRCSILWLFLNPHKESKDFKTTFKDSSTNTQERVNIAERGIPDNQLKIDCSHCSMPPKRIPLFTVLNADPYIGGKTNRWRTIFGIGGRCQTYSWTSPEIASLQQKYFHGSHECAPKMLRGCPEMTSSVGGGGGVFAKL